MFINGKWPSYACLIGLAALGRVGAQDAFKYTGCSDVTSANFTKVALVNRAKDASLEEPIRFAVANNGDVYLAERNGPIKVVKAAGTIVKVGTIPVYPTTSGLKKNVAGNKNNELGLTGLALDPNFSTNHYIYVDYEPNTPDVMNISRFTLNGDVLDLASEKVLLSFPMQKDYCCHTGGSMAFDNKGNLFISVGDNLNINDNYVNEANPVTDDQSHAANTNDYRGKILRIHPTPEGSYTVPAGNFKDYYASMWSAADLAKVKPELYTVGHRNPYTISVDTLKNLLTWGDVGPDEGWATEELNSTNKPGFMGWPYFAGAEGNPHYLYRLNKTPATPMNLSPNNTGVKALPAAIGATIGYNESAAITGPIYRYSSNQTSAKKVPPHFDGKWFVSDFKAGWFHIVSLDDAGTTVTATNNFLGGLVGPIQVSIGPDGMLYVLEYGTFYNFNSAGGTDDGAGSNGKTQLSRYEYTGPACAGVTSIQDQADARANAAAGKMGMLLNLGIDAKRTVAMPVGARGFQLYDLQGKMIWQHQAAEKTAGAVSVPVALGNGVYRVKFEY